MFIFGKAMNEPEVGASRPQGQVIGRWQLFAAMKSQSVLISGVIASQYLES